MRVHVLKMRVSHRSGGQSVFLPLDLSSPASVCKFVQLFTSLFRTCDILINNAGIMFVPYSTTEFVSLRTGSFFLLKVTCNRCVVAYYHAVFRVAHHRTVVDTAARKVFLPPSPLFTYPLLVRAHTLSLVRSQGWESHMAVNHLGHAMLTALLLPEIQSSALAAGPIVVSVSSIGHIWSATGGIKPSAHTQVRTSTAANRVPPLFIRECFAILCTGIVHARRFY